MNSKKGKKVHLEIILFFIVSIYCLLAPNRETCMDDTWISSIVGLSGSVKLFSVKLFLLAPLWWGILCYILLRLANPYLKEHGVKLAAGRFVPVWRARLVLAAGAARSGDVQRHHAGGGHGNRKTI